MQRHSWLIFTVQSSTTFFVYLKKVLQQSTDFICSVENLNPDKLNESVKVSENDLA